MATEQVEEIRKALAAEKLVIGTDVVLKRLKNGEVSKVFVANNTPEIVKSDIAHYAKLGKTEVAYLEESNEDLKEICKKRFNISIVASIQ